VKIGMCLQVFYDRSLEEALEAARALGFDAVELAVDRRSPLVDLEAAIANGGRDIARKVKNAGLEISALSNHQEGQLLLGPHGTDTDPMFEGTPEEKVAYSTKRLKMTAELANALEVNTVCGFMGCEDYSRWFPWPLEDGFEQMGPVFVERMSPILDHYQTLGVRFAHECHPRQLAYNLETAKWVLEILEEHPAFGFNLDPANLVLAGMDPIVFVVEMVKRIFHVHAKDSEKVTHSHARSGLFAHGRWDRRDRGFRFRMPGWGDLDWRKLITELHIGGFQGVLSVEHEDPTMSREEGLRQAVSHLRPLLLQEPPGGRWW
jgi:sugar phosphate isomerase/epimerase